MEMGWCMPTGEMGYTLMADSVPVADCRMVDHLIIELLVMAVRDMVKDRISTVLMDAWYILLKEYHLVEQVVEVL